MYQYAKRNVKGVAHNGKPRVNYHPVLQFPVFKLTVLVLRPTTLRFYFTLISAVSIQHRQLFLAK